MAVSTVKLTLNGQTYDLTYNSSSGKYEATITAPTTTSWGETDHVYAGTVTATDEAGNETTVSRTDFSSLGLRVLEKTAPTITVTYPTAGAYITTATPTISWTVADTGSGIDDATISITVDGTKMTTGITKTATANGYTCTYAPASALSEGSHTVAFDVDDHDGNSATQSTVSFTVDTVPPTLNITAPVDGLVTKNATLTVSGTTNDETSSPVTLTVNGKTVTVGTGGAFSTTVDLTEGENTITVIATDTAGKSTTVTRTVTLDTAAPVITAVTLTPNPADVGATVIVSVTVTD